MKALAAAAIVGDLTLNQLLLSGLVMGTIVGIVGLTGNKYKLTIVVDEYDSGERERDEYDNFLFV